jgi:RNA recognition motif-containing protein
MCYRPPPRAPTPPEVIEAREREKELKELDRDTRTVFAYNLNLKADERDLFEFFSQAGEVSAEARYSTRFDLRSADTAAAPTSVRIPHLIFR